MTLLVLVLLTAVAFEYINGFHDTANAIATVVSTKVLTPRLAILLACVFNLVGALSGTAVASTIGKGMVDTHVVTMITVLCALLAAIIWNLFTWLLGIPSSSTHALIGGLCGAALAASGGNWNVLYWSTGLWPKVVLPLILSPVLGFVFGAILMFALTQILRKTRPRTVTSIFGKAQIASAAFMGWSHGSNDAQKTMGIITLALVTATHKGILNNVPSWASFLRIQEFTTVPFLGHFALRVDDGGGNGGGRLANHQDHGAQDGEASADPRLRRGDDGRGDHFWSVSLWYPGVDDPRDRNVHHGCRRLQKAQCRQMGIGRQDRVGVGAHLACHVPFGLSPRPPSRIGLLFVSSRDDSLSMSFRTGRIASKGSRPGLALSLGD